MASTTRDRPIVATPLQEAKQPVTAAAGPYGHPFHPILVTVPIGAWVVSLVFDIASHSSGEPDVFVKGAFWLIGAGIIGAVVAAVFGLLDLLAIPRGTPAFRTGLTHMAMNLTVVALFAVSFGVRHGNLDVADSTTAGVVLSVIALAILVVSGWLGGKLAYRYGVRVADERTQAEGFSSN
jgi:uncharacterized membrane protein